MKLTNLTLLSLIALLGAALLLVGAYSLRSEQVIAVGELGDAPFVSGFNQDEAGAPRYRWTGSNRSLNEAVGIINFPVRPNPSGPNRLEIELGAASGKAFEVIVLANGVEIGRAATVAGKVNRYSFAVPPEALASDNFRLEIKSPAFTPGGGDSRSLGVKVQEVRLVSSPALRLPPLEVWLWAALYTLAAGAALFYFTRRALLSAGIGAALLLPWLILPYLAPRNLNLWYLPYLLPIAAILALLVALFVWREQLTAALWDFPAQLEKGQLARNVLLVITLLYLAYSFNIIIRMDYIGHADYADNGVVARNLVRGQGLSADYAAQFYLKYPSLPRPADTWPLLQPVLIAPFFALFGPNAVAAKLPNLLLMGALAWAIFYYGSRLFNRRTALGTALLCLGAPAFFETVAYPINDLSYTLLMWLALCAIYQAATFRPPISGAATGEATNKIESQNAEAKTPGSILQRGWRWLSHPLRRSWLLAGLWAGLLFLSKPSGGILMAAAGLWLLFQKYTNKGLTIPWRGLFVWGGVAFMVITPLILRNQLQFGTPFYSTEQKDAWLLKYYPPDERIYDLYYTNPAKALPAPNGLLLYGFDTIFKTIGNQFTKGWNDLWGGNYIAPLLLILVALGLMVLPRRRASLVGLLSFVFVVYVLFINIYWHYEIRYFMAWLPWCYAFGLYGLGWIYDKMKGETLAITQTGPSKKPKGQWAAWGIVAAFLVLWLPGLQKIVEDGPGYTGKTGIVIAADWLKQNTPGQARVMSRNIWELSFHSDRQGVMIPNSASLDEIKRVMRDYNVRYLQLDHTNLDGNRRPDEPVWSMRQSLWPLIRKETDQAGQVSGFKLVYQDKNGFYIYELVS